MGCIISTSDNFRTILGERVAAPINHPFSEEFLSLFEAMEDVRQAKKQLTKAERENKNRYTGQYSSEYFIQEEQHQYNVAVNHASEILMKIVSGNGGNVYNYTPFQSFMDSLIDFDKLTDKEKEVMDGMTYVGDLIMAVENDPHQFGSKLYKALSPKTKKLFQKIPLRQGSENWRRPGTEIDD